MVLKAQPSFIPGLVDGRQSEAATAVAQGTRRFLRSMGVATICEFNLGNGRRADIAGIGPDGAIYIVEIKSSIQDFRSDIKWRDYLAYCDFYFFAAPLEMDPAVFPGDMGFIAADAYGAEIVRPSTRQPVSSARRKAMLVSFSQNAANRLHSLQDPLV